MSKPESLPVHTLIAHMNSFIDAKDWKIVDKNEHTEAGRDLDILGFFSTIHENVKKHISHPSLIDDHITIYTEQKDILKHASAHENILKWIMM